MKKAFSGAPAEEMEKAYAEHNRCYARFFHYFYESIYKDKYYVMGDYDTMTTAFPPRHRPLLRRGDHARLPLVARPARRSAVLPGRRGGRLLPDPLLQPAPRRDREAQEGARHLRQPQRWAAPRLRRLLRPIRFRRDDRARPAALVEGGARERVDVPGTPAPAAHPCRPSSSGSDGSAVSLARRT